MRTLLTLSASLFCAAAALGQTGRAMFQRTPAIPGQTAQCELTFPASAAGNIYAFLASVPPYAPATPISVPGFTVQGLARVNPLSNSSLFSGLLGPSGSIMHGIAVPNSPVWLGFAFDLQSIDLSLATSTLAFADNDLTIAVQGPRQWRAPTIVASGTQTAPPAVAVNAQGNAVTVFRSGTSPGLAMASHCTPGSGWSAPVAISTASAYQCEAGIDGNGNAFAVWVDLGSQSIMASRCPAGGVWSAPLLLETGAGDAGDPQLAVDGAGNAIAAWWQWDGAFNSGSISVFANRYSPGSGWGSATPIESGTQGEGEPPRIACDAAGNATVVWRWSYPAGTGYASTIWSNRFTVGTGWGTAGPVTNATSVPGNVPPEVAVDGNGNAMAIWEASGAGHREMHASYRQAGTWGPTLRLDPPNTLMSDTPRIAALPNGNFMAVWAEHNGTVYHIMASTHAAGSGWAPATVVAANSLASSRYPGLTIDGLGQATVIYRLGNPGSYSTCWATRGTPGGAFTTPVQIDGNNHSGIVGTDLGSDANGNVIAVIEVYAPDGSRQLLASEYR